MPESKKIKMDALWLTADYLKGETKIFYVSATSLIWV